MRKEIVLLSLLASCTQLSKKNCLEKNWFEKGKIDKSKKLNTTSKLEEYEKSCSQHGVEIPAKKYLLGVKKTALIQCTQVDKNSKNIWFEAGKKFALEGKTYSQRIEVKKKCASVETPDYKEFRRGYSLGLKLFCSEVGGYKFGRQGHKYNFTCNKRAEKKFQKGYKIGLTEFKIEGLDVEIQEVTSSAKRKRIEYKELKSEFKAVEYELINFDWRNRQSVKEIKSDISEIENEIKSARENNQSTEKIANYNLKLSQLKSKLQDEQEEIIEERKDKRRRYNFLRTRLKRLNTEIKALKIQINLLNKSKKKMEKSLT